MDVAPCKVGCQEYSILQGGTRSIPDGYTRMEAAPTCDGCALPRRRTGAGQLKRDPGDCAFLHVTGGPSQRPKIRNQTCGRVPKPGN